MEVLKNLQRRDFYRHPMRQLATYVTNLINKRTAASVTTRLIKVKFHRGEPLNEAADASASEAAELDPSRPLDLDPEAVYFYCKGVPMEWDTKLRDSLTHVAAAQDAGLIGKHARRKDGPRQSLYARSGCSGPTRAERHWERC